MPCANGVAVVNSLFVGASNELGEFELGATAALFGLVPQLDCEIWKDCCLCPMGVDVSGSSRRDRLVEPRAAQR